MGNGVGNLMNSHYERRHAHQIGLDSRISHSCSAKVSLNPTSKWIHSIPFTISGKKVPKALTGRVANILKTTATSFFQSVSTSDISHADHAGVFDGISVFTHFEVFNHLDVHSLERVFAFGLGED